MAIKNHKYTASDIASAAVDMHQAHAALLRAALDLPEVANTLRVKVERACSVVKEVLDEMELA